MGDPVTLLDESETIHDTYQSVYEKLQRIYEKHRRNYPENGDSEQMCRMRSTRDPCDRIIFQIGVIPRRNFITSP
jgi:hypothetical protein